MDLNRLCLICNKKLKKFDQEKFCSKACFAVYKKEKPNFKARKRVTVNCSLCNKEFWTWKSRIKPNKRYFCSEHCKLRGWYKTKKICPECKQEKSRSDFGELSNVCKYNKLIRYRCKDCSNKVLRNWKKEFKNKNSISYEATYVNKSKTNYFKIAVKRAKTSAKRTKMKDLSFDITPEFIEELYYKQNGRCVYTNKELELVHGKGKRFNNLSIDRINSNLGYIKDNVQLVTYIANVMKTELSHQEFLDICNLITNNYKDRDNNGTN